MAYALRFCEAQPPRSCIASDQRLMQRLSNERYWWDGSHLTRYGARLYTRWLADRLVWDMEIKASH